MNLDEIVEVICVGICKINDIEFIQTHPSIENLSQKLTIISNKGNKFSIRLEKENNE